MVHAGKRPKEAPMKFPALCRRLPALLVAALCLAGAAACSGGGDAAKGPPPAPVHVRPGLL